MKAVRSTNSAARTCCGWRTSRILPSPAPGKSRSESGQARSITSTSRCVRLDLVYEHAGGELFQKGLDSLKKDGRLVVCGAHSGEVVPLDIIAFFRTQKSIIGSLAYTKAEVETCFELAARGRIKPLVHATFPLEQAKEATDLMERREHFGKIILTPDGGAA